MIHQAAEVTSLDVERERERERMKAVISIIVHAARLVVY